MKDVRMVVLYPNKCPCRSVLFNSSQLQLPRKDCEYTGNMRLSTYFCCSFQMSTNQQNFSDLHGQNLNPLPPFIFALKEENIG